MICDPLRAEAIINAKEKRLLLMVNTLIYSQI